MRTTRRLVVAGSINEDLVARVPRLPAPGETVSGSSVTRRSGGKGANQAVAAARLGAVVLLTGAVGADDPGRTQLRALSAEGVDTTAVHVAEDDATGLALVSVDDLGENSIIVVPGANDAVGQGQVDRLSSMLAPSDVFLTQLELPLPTVLAALQAARAAGAFTMLNAAPMHDAPDLTRDVDMLVVNHSEAVAFVEHRQGTDAQGLARLEPAELAALVSDVAQCAVAVTFGPRGVVLARGSAALSVPGVRVDVVDTTGAGDTFVGALAAQLCTGAGLEEALALANAAAAIACTGAGAQTAMPTGDVLERFRKAL